MWAYAQSDGRPVEYRWRLLFNAVDQIAKISLWCNLGTKKQRAVLSNYKADVYETLQLLLERNVFISFSNYTSSESHCRSIVGQNIQIFMPQNVGIQIGPFDLRYEITPHSDILAKVRPVLRPRRLEREKK